MWWHTIKAIPFFGSYSLLFLTPSPAVILLYVQCIQIISHMQKEPKPSQEQSNSNIWQPDTQKNTHFSHSADQVKHHIARVLFAAIAEIKKWHSGVENLI